MSENQLLLSSANTGNAHSFKQSPLWKWRLFAVGVGCLVVFVGALDVLSRVEHAAASIDLSGVVPQGIGYTAFAPAAALGNTSFFANPPTAPTVVPTTSTQTPPPAATAKKNNAPVVSASKNIPVAIKIPSIGVNAAVEQVEKKADGSMGTPKNINHVGWYSLGPKPGQAGNMVMDGHVNNALSLPGVFTKLSEVSIGDYITVEGSDGHSYAYKVTQVNTYPTKEAPISDIFATSGPSQLVLITCDGDWVDQDHSYDKRLVVVARLMYP